MSPHPYLTALLVVLAVGNVALTVIHARILRRARAYQADTARLHAEAERLLGNARAIADTRLMANGHRLGPGDEWLEP